MNQKEDCRNCKQSFICSGKVELVDKPYQKCPKNKKFERDF